MKCNKCGKENAPNIYFCVDCGNLLRVALVDYNDLKKKYFSQSILLFISIVLTIIFSFRGLMDIPFIVHEYLFNGLLVLLTIVFFILDIKGFIKILRFSFHIKPILLIILGAPFLALLVIFIAKYLSYSLGIKSSFYYINYLENTSNMYFYGLLFVSFLPGFIEEFLFRGILFNHLLRLTSPKATILISSILFSFIHFSFFFVVMVISNRFVSWLFAFSVSDNMVQYFFPFSV